MRKYIHGWLQELKATAGFMEPEDIAQGNSKKLMRGNLLLHNKKVFRILCVAVVLVVILAVTLACRFVTNIGNIVRGSFSPALLFIPSWRYTLFYLIGLLVAVGFCVALYFKIRINFRELNVGQKGHARFMEPGEVAHRFTKVPQKDKSFPGWGGAPIAHCKDGIYIDETVVNNAIYCITRGGKTEGLAVPTIDIVSRAEQKASMIIPDAKGNLCNACIPHLIERGYQVYILDMFDFKHTHYYNPLHVICEAYAAGDIDLAEELAADLAHIFIEDGDAKDRFWVDGPRALYTALVLALIEDCIASGNVEKVTLYSIFVLLASLGKSTSKQKKEQGLDTFFLERPLTNPARLAYTSIEFSEGKTRSSLLSITISRLDAYRRSNIAKLTAKNTLDMTELGFGDKPCAVFLRAPFYTQVYNALVSTFISQCFYMNMRKAAIENTGKCKRRIRVVGDEFFNFPAIPSLDTMVTVGLGAGWSFDIYAQSPVQAEEKYGKETAKVVFENCATTYYLISPSEETRKLISEMCGNITVENVMRSGERFSLNKNITEQFEERPLIPPQELAEMKEGEGIVIPSMRRRDLAGNKVSALPIFCRGEMSFKYRYEYLPEFDPDAAIPYNKLGLDTEDSTFNLNDLFYAADTVSRPQDETLMVTDCFIPSKIQYILQVLPADFAIDLSNTPMDRFTEILETLHMEGMITDTHYKTLHSMLQKETKEE